MLVGDTNRKLIVYRHQYVNKVRKLYKTYHNIVPFHVQRSVDIFIIICCWRGIFLQNKLLCIRYQFTVLPVALFITRPLFFPVTFHILIIHSIGLYIYIFLAILVNVTLYIVGLKCSTLEADMFTYIPLTLNFRFQSELALQICRLDKAKSIDRIGYYLSKCV